MGFFFKKRIKLAKGLNLNLSKSGVGFSFGVKGFRISKNSRGTYLNAGRNGLYCRTKLDKKARNSQENIEITNSEKETLFVYQKKDVNIYSNLYIATIIFAVIGLVLLCLLKVIGLVLMIAAITLNIQLKKGNPIKHAEMESFNDKVLNERKNSDIEVKPIVTKETTEEPLKLAKLQFNFIQIMNILFLTEISALIWSIVATSKHIHHAEIVGALTILFLPVFAIFYIVYGIMCIVRKRSK